MVDPVSVGGLVALALSTATEAIVKGFAEEGTKDVYNALKERLSRLNSADVEALEKSPTSIGKQAIVAELVDSQSGSEREALRRLAQELSAALSGSPKEQAVYAEWKAELVTRESRHFAIEVHRLNDRHRIEFVFKYFGFDAIELDGFEIAKNGGILFRKKHKFYIGMNREIFELKYTSSMTSTISDIELLVDNRLIFRAK